MNETEGCGVRDRFLRGTVLLAIAAILVCNPSSPDPGGQSDCRDCYSFQCRGFDPADDVTAHVTFPLGKESFRVGDTMSIGLCYEDTSMALGGEELKLVFTSGKVLDIDVFWSETPPSVVAELKQGRYRWVIGPKLKGVNEMGGIDSFPVTGDSIRIKFEGYGQASDRDFDYSGYFSIQ